MGVCVCVCTHMNERFSFSVEVCGDFLVLFIDICLYLRLSGRSTIQVCCTLDLRCVCGVGGGMSVGGFDSGSG